MVLIEFSKQGILFSEHILPIIFFSFLIKFIYSSIILLFSNKCRPNFALIEDISYVGINLFITFIISSLPNKYPILKIKLEADNYSSQLLMVRLNIKF